MNPDNPNLRNYVDQTIPYPKDADRATKAVVNFDCVGVIERHPSGVYTATLKGITNHPRLGQQPYVFTSQIKAVKFDDAGDIVEVETRNTMYVKSEPKSVTG